MTTNTVVPTASLLAFMILVPAIHGQDDDALPIVKGYGESAWGQSLAEVQKIWPDGKAKIQGGFHVAYEIAAAASGDGPITKRILNLIDDQLHGVVAVYELPGRPERGEDEEGFALIEALIKKKYPAEPLAAAGIMIRAVPRPDGSIQVSYLNVKILRAAEQAIKERQEQEAAERRGASGRAKILEALELEGTL